jgi:hypothetical protein
MYQGYPAPPQAFPAEINQLAASYGLGQPQSQYSHASAGYLRIAIASFLGLLILAAAPMFMVIAQLPGSPFSSFPILILFIIPLLAILIFIVYSLSLLRSRAYTCAGGFMMLSGKQLKWAMRWDQIQQVWKERRRIRKSGGTYSTFFNCFISDTQGQTHKVDYLEIWKRANYEHARHEFAQIAPQMLADFNAGQYLLFGPLSVDQHGVNIPGSMTYRGQSYQLPLPAIFKTSLGQRLTFETTYVGGNQTVSASIPENATRLLLLLETLSQGRIKCEYEDWLIR